MNTKPTKCMIVCDSYTARRMQEELGDEWRVVCPGSPFSGYAYRLFVFTEGWDKEWRGLPKELEFWRSHLLSKRIDKHNYIVIEEGK